MGVEWTRRILTVVVAAPAAMYLLGSSIGTAVLATVIMSGCLIEFRLNLCPPLLLHVVGQKPEAKNHLVHAAFVVSVGCLVAVAATQSKPLHGRSTHSVSNAATSAGYVVVFGYHLLLATTRSPPSKATSLLAGIVDLFLDLVAMTYIVQYIHTLFMSTFFPHVYYTHANVSGFSHAILVRHATSYGMGLQVRK
ncbi:hypothetical protein AaE_010952 [Aphanomyces astaci]|uniref:Uncharacterized protein n=1 Tax=Aphanomyces astaci TaxID=112090 RepID=A0A6A4ZX41_APHAT|nr:hypothetical protein AaE_010952 [Aphanomyces astaci]